MTSARSIRSLTVLLSCLFAFLCASNLSAQERLLVNGKVFTGNPQHPYAEAVAIRGNKIVAVGSRTEAAASLRASPEILDLGGKTLFPGLIDSHVHAISGGVKLLSTDVANKVSNIDELASIAAEAKKTGRGMRGDILFVSGLPLQVWSHIDQLNTKFNAGEFAAQPVFLQGMDGHTGWANQAMRNKAGLNKAYLSGLTEAERKYYGYEADFTPNGFGVDAGLRMVRKQIPGPDAKKLLAGAQAAVDYLHSLGITSWLDPSVDEKGFAAYRDLAAEKKLTAHVAGFVVVEADDPDPLAETRALKKKFGGVPGLTIPGVKVYADGVVEYPSQSAAMFAPYGKTGKVGDLRFDPTKFAALCIQADKEGLIVHGHAIGDRAVAETLNGIEAARKTNGNSGLPHTITHLQFVRPEDIQRFKPLGVIASFQLLWAAADIDTIDIVQPFVTPEIYKWQYPARSMLNAGAMISGASDWGVSSPNVFFAIYQAETRKGPKGILDANEDMPREAMLYAYTINAARAMNQQDTIGSIDPGKEADLILLDRDVMTVSPEEMRDTKVLWTMVGGDWVYRAKP